MLIYYRILVLKNGQVYDRQLERSDEFSISAYFADMLAHGYGLDIEAIEVPAGLKTRESQVLWAMYCDSPSFGVAVDAAFEREHITQRERLVLLRAGVDRAIANRLGSVR